MKKFFFNYGDARKFIKNASLKTEPFKTQVWIDGRFSLIWTVEV